MKTPWGSPRGQGAADQRKQACRVPKESEKQREAETERQGERDRGEERTQAGRGGGEGWVLRGVEAATASVVPRPLGNGSAYHPCP